MTRITIAALFGAALALAGCGVRARVLGAEGGLGTLAGPGATAELQSETTGRTIAKVSAEVSVPDALAWLVEQAQATAIGQTILGAPKAQP